MNARDPLLPLQPDEATAIAAFASKAWDEQIVPALTDYIAIPAKSPMFDADWQANGHIERAEFIQGNACIRRGQREQASAQIFGIRMGQRRQDLQVRFETNQCGVDAIRAGSRNQAQE